MYDILELVEKTYLPFASTVSDADIKDALEKSNFINKRLIYERELLFTVQSKRKHNKRKIATIANEILKGTYNFNIAFTVWQDKEGYIDFDDYAMFHVRAFHYCNQNIPVQINKQN
jgi:hypothetical protein